VSELQCFIYAWVIVGMVAFVELLYVFPTQKSRDKKKLLVVAILFIMLGWISAICITPLAWRKIRKEKH